MSNHDPDLQQLNQAAESLSDELLGTAFDRVTHVADVYGIAAADVPLLLANAFFRLAVHTNATALHLDGDDLGKRMMQTLKSAAKA